MLATRASASASRTVRGPAAEDIRAPNFHSRRGRAMTTPRHRTSTRARKQGVCTTSTLPPRACCCGVRREAHIPTGVWYALAAFGFRAAHRARAARAVHASARAARLAGDRRAASCSMNTLEPGERVVRSVPVFRRTGGGLLSPDARAPRAHRPPPDLPRQRPARLHRRVRRAADVRPARVPHRYARRLEPSFALLGFARASRDRVAARRIVNARRSRG